MAPLSKGQHITSPDGPGEVMEVVSDNFFVIKLDSGETRTFTFAELEIAPLNHHEASPGNIGSISGESPEHVIARAEHARQIVARLDHHDLPETEHAINENLTNPSFKQQTPMEISEKALDVINDLIEINNDRVEGFEKASRDLEGQDEDLIMVFNKMAAQSEQNVAELTDIVLQYGGDPAEGSSTSGALHRAWLDIKSAFTGGDMEAVLNECERGEDAIKAAYFKALDPENELSPEIVEVLQTQQMGIVASHDLIKSLCDQLEEDEDDEDEDDDIDDTVAGEPAYQDGAAATGTTYASSTTNNEYGQQTFDAPAPESIAQEEAWEEKQTTATGSSKLMEFFVDELKDLLWAERELAETLPDMAEAATSQELKTAFTNHLAETEVHITRLEQIFGILGLEPDTTKCDAMAGIVDEGDEIISHTEEGTAQRDVGLIFAGQKAEHYEIASYGGMVSLAKTLGFYDIAEILVLTLDEEKTADALLTEIAENHVNYEASTEPGE